VIYAVDYDTNSNVFAARIDPHYDASRRVRADELAGDQLCYVNIS